MSMLSTSIHLPNDSIKYLIIHKNLSKIQKSKVIICFLLKRNHFNKLTFQMQPKFFLNYLKISKFLLRMQIISMSFHLICTINLNSITLRNIPLFTRFIYILLGTFFQIYQLYLYRNLNIISVL